MSTLKDELAAKVADPLATKDAGVHPTQVHNAVPGLPSQQTDIVYILWFRTGQNPHPLFTGFTMKTKQMSVVMERCKAHCDRMGYRFVRVVPFMINMDEAERRQNGDYAG